MATKSIYKNVSFKKRTLSHALVRALENASEKGSKVVTLQKQYREIRGSEIKNLFGVSE